jgi:hypothetical protein
MHLCPLQYESEGAARQFSTDDFKCSNINQCLEFSLQSVEVRWDVISEVHLDQNPVKPADRRHSCRLSYPSMFTKGVVYVNSTEKERQITPCTQNRRGQRAQSRRWTHFDETRDNLNSTSERPCPNQHPWGMLALGNATNSARSAAFQSGIPSAPY